MWYHITDNGDGSVFLNLYESKELAELSLLLSEHEMEYFGQGHQENTGKVGEMETVDKVLQDTKKELEEDLNGDNEEDALNLLVTKLEALKEN